jgi:hypothetical protein
LHARRGAQTARLIEGHDPPMVENQNAVGNFFHLRGSMRSKQESRSKPTHQIMLNEMAEVGSGERIKAARGFIEKKYGGFME